MTQPKPMNDHRVFLGLDRPPLESAAGWFLDRFQTESCGTATVDLSEFLVVLPTKRARGRLLQLLVQGAESRGVILTPPQIRSMGNFPEELYVAEKPLATDLAQQIAWSMCLEEASSDDIEILTGQTEVSDLQDWQPLAKLISKLHARLANDIWSFKSVAREVQGLKNFLREELSRWDVLSRLQDAFYKKLGQVDLWDRQAARNFAASGLLKNQEIRCHTDKTIVMVGTADLNRSVTEMLKQVATTSPDRIHILVAADDSLSDCFDSFGNLITEEWLGRKLPLSNEQILIVDQPADQADAVAHYLGSLGKRYSTDEMTVGVPDPEIIPQLQRSLNAIQVRHRNLTGKPLSETAPVRLMLACRDFLEHQDYDSFASLVRHPDLFDWLCRQVDDDQWINRLDEYQKQFLPNRLEIGARHPFGSPDSIRKEFDETDQDSKRHAERQAMSVSVLNLLHHYVSTLLQPMLAGEKSIVNWSKPWTLILEQVYGDREMDPENPSDCAIIRACEAIYTALGDQQQVPENFRATSTATQALDWAIEAATEHRVIEPPIADAIELAGWLDLTLDDAPVMVVTGFNEEHVPATEHGHQFLPNELCKTLGILDNDRRLARDTYATHVICSVRDNIRFVVGRRDESAEPKKPSRLLFMCDEMVAARRAKAFFSYRGKAAATRWLAPEFDRVYPESQQFVVPEPKNIRDLERLSVTKFKSYIECPYRFYLKHVLKLDAVVDDLRELDGGLFGDLTHAVVESFGRSELKDSMHADEIRDYFVERLNYFVEQRYFGSRLPAVQLQVRLLQQRLERFAECQAAHRKSGWKIVSIEEHLFHKFMVDEKPFIINGKIDRVDRHEETGQVAVWDYKSSDKGNKPGEDHYKTRRKEWINLQLPLYRHLVREVDVVKDADFSNLLMGYILLPKKLEDIGFSEVSWTQEELLGADKLAREIVRKVRKKKYWPPSMDPPKFAGPFGPICQDNTFEQYSWEDASEEDGVVAPW